MPSKNLNAQFFCVINDYILPLFPGATMRLDTTSKVSTARKLCAIQYGSTSIALRQKMDTTPILIERAQIFSSEDTKIVSDFITQWNTFTLEKKLPIFYQNTIAEKCLEYAILKNVAQGYSRVLNHLFSIISYWQNRTYEGNKVAFSLKISRDVLKINNGKTLLTKDDLYREDFFASVSNGLNDCIVFDANLDIVCHDDLMVNTTSEFFAPCRLAGLCDASDNAVVLALTRANEILIFADKSLSYAKRNGKWTIYNHDTTIMQLAGGTRNTIPTEVRKNMYLSALDVSFSKTGGLIACIDKKNVNKAIPLFKDDLLCSNSPKGRVAVYKQLVAGKKFQDLSRTLRMELLAIDGATVIDSDGNVLAIGSIVKLDGGSSSGGRKAATVALSKYGTAIKISNDSYIEGYREGLSLFKI